MRILYLLLTMLGGIIEESVIYHDVRNALDYAKSICEKFYISDEHFKQQQQEGWGNDAQFYFSNDIGGDENEYEIFIHPIKIDDAPLPALVVGEQHTVLAEVRRLMEKGYHPIDMEVTIDGLTSPYSDRRQYSVLMTSVKI